MPNRVIRDWTDSETIDQLSPEGERFFARLLMKADDFGYYHANPKILNSKLFPLKDTITNENIITWLRECQTATNTDGTRLIELYKHRGKDYLFIPNFGQRLRIMKSKFPNKPENGMPPELPFEGLKTTSPEGQTTSLRDAFFKDLPNSTHIQVISSDLGLSTETLVSMIPDFKKVAEVEYATFQKFIYHFKNWANKESKKVKDNTNNSTTITIGKKKNR